MRAAGYIAGLALLPDEDSGMKKIMVVLLALLVISCSRDHEPVSTASTNNPDVPISLLFEHEGARVYRFYDAGDFHYFVLPVGVVLASHTETCGKNCVTIDEESIYTVAAAAGER
jgi:hypothetical protein